MEGRLRLKLKPGSIPTVFAHSKPTKRRPSSTARENIQKRKALVKSAFEEYSLRELEGKKEKEQMDKKTTEGLLKNALTLENPLTEYTSSCNIDVNFYKEQPGKIQVGNASAEHSVSCHIENKSEGQHEQPRKVYVDLRSLQKHSQKCHLEERSKENNRPMIIIFVGNALAEHAPNARSTVLAEHAPNARSTALAEHALNARSTVLAENAPNARSTALAENAPNERSTALAEHAPNARSTVLAEHTPNARSTVLAERSLNCDSVEKSKETNRQARKAFLERALENQSLNHHFGKRWKKSFTKGKVRRKPF